jgi:DNA-binding transcriptional regulator YdaS (Cro superfamily)
MDLTAWLEGEKGRSAALAAHFDVTPAAISQWKKNGVPVDHMKAVRDFTDGAVTLEEMVPEPSAEVVPAVHQKLARRPTKATASESVWPPTQQEVDRIVFGAAQPPSAPREDRPCGKREER